jgi:NSS family neurotransmitter:Na+ symporter
MGGILGLTIGISFFFLLSLAALTSTISLLEVPTSYIIDEHGVRRKKAALYVGLTVLAISIIISFNDWLIGDIDYIFSVIGLPLGGLFICIFIGYFWKTRSAVEEMKNGFKDIRDSWFTTVWSVFIKYICPIIILLILAQTILG